eukprot:TRINITY_DN827_c2_g1_i1.p3 TRINITY_DN827_c2_g1~~TRINITY_DN827_c2_g1_i1.p3  ORF type:complete len:104 (+),score=1.97 TRINITY_DN827_c2_g1_i1:354-665(+)
MWGMGLGVGGARSLRPWNWTTRPALVLTSFEFLCVDMSDGRVSGEAHRLPPPLFSPFSSFRHCFLPFTFSPLFSSALPPTESHGLNRLVIRVCVCVRVRVCCT